MTGGRANLIAIACNDLLGQLDLTKRVIDEAAVDQALASDGIIDALDGWQRLINDEAAARLDRIIIYIAAETGAFTRQDLLQRLGERGFEPAPEHVEPALRRLELAFILGRSGGDFDFRVPLFQEIAKENAEAYLESELKQARAAGQ